MEDNYIICHNFLGDSIAGKAYYFWDSQFSDPYCPVNFASLENCENFMKVKEFRSADGYDFRLAVFESK